MLVCVLKGKVHFCVYGCVCEKGRGTVCVSVCGCVRGKGRVCVCGIEKGVLSVYLGVWVCMCRPSRSISAEPHLHSDI